MPLNHIKWPDNPKDAKRLFLRRKPLREIIVMIDGDLLWKKLSTSKLDKRLVLTSLLNHELIEYFRYTDEGPPANIKPIKTKAARFSPPYPVYEGWVVAYPFDSGHWPVMYSSQKDTYTVGGMNGNAPQVARTDESTQAYSDLSAEDRATRREADVIALHVASQALQADLFITERPYLYSGSPLAKQEGLTVCTPEEAITIIALYLRTQKEFALPSEHEAVKLSFNEGLYFWVGARELLPEGWRWFSACVQHSSALNDDKLMLLGGSLLSRITKALQARDDVHAVLNLRSNNDTNDAALGSLDTVLVLLMGAVDASARVAHYILGLPAGQEYGAAWQKRSWHQQITTAAPVLASITDAGTTGEHTLTILRLLRNSVHGAALQGVSVLEDRRQEMLVGLPANDEAGLLAAMDAMGGRDSWGFRQLLPGRSHVEPAILVDRLFEAVIELLNALMKKTPVERLAHVVVTADSSKPPAPEQGKMDTFSEWNRLAIRCQLGF